MENKLIEIYLLICHIYDMNKHLHLQENRNRLPNLSVPELMTIYLFGQLNGQFKHRHIYNFTRHYWFEWFPALGSYQAFNRRLNLLENHFHAVFDFLLADLHSDARHQSLFGDKAYADAHFKGELHSRRIELFTPIKKPKNRELPEKQKRANKTISTFRQPIESFFKWLIDKTDIQRASSVRSTDGLLIHCIGKLSFALLLLNFYY